MNAQKAVGFLVLEGDREVIERDFRVPGGVTKFEQFFEAGHPHSHCRHPEELPIFAIFYPNLSMAETKCAIWRSYGLILLTA
jgi:hypothetical protein